MDDIVFAGKISKQGVMKIIVIPKKIHSKLKNLDGQILIKINKLS